MRSSVAVVISCVCTLSFAVEYPVQASINKDNNIPAENLGAALKTLAATYDFQVLYRSDVVKGRRTSGASGSLSPKEALGQVLNGTGLSYKYLDEKTVTIFPIGSSNSVSSADAAATPTGDSRDGEKEEEKNTSGSFRLAQVDQGHAGGDVSLTNPGASDSQPSAGALQEILVTASKTGTSAVQKTPIAITAFTSSQLEAANLTNVQDLQGFVPNLSISQSTSFAEIYIRGVGSSNVYAGTDPSATVQVDGVYLGRPYSQFSDFLDVDRVEVLRGPQGTLYGRNAIAGTINVVSRQPGDVLAAENRLTVGNYSAFEAQGYISGPLVDQVLQASVAYTYVEHDPYIHNIVPTGNGVFDADRHGVHAQLRFAPTATFEATTRVDYSKSDENVESYTKLLAPYDPTTDSILGDYSKVALNLPQRAETVNKGVAEDVTVHATDHLQIRSITAFREASTNENLDADGTERDINDVHLEEHQKQFSQELNLVGNYDHLDFVAGLYYLTEDIRVKNSVDLVTSDLGLLFLPDVTTNSRAAFAQGTYHVTSQFDLTVGARYTKESKSLKQNSAYYINFAGGIFLQPPPGATAIVGPVVYDEDGSYSAFTPKFGMQWSPTADLMIYASATRGFKSGGVDYSSLDPTTAAYRPETVWSYEAGLKSYFLDRRLRANLTAFYYDYKDLQVQVLTGPTSEITSNAASATSKGLELELATTPVDGLTLTANLAYLRARYEKYADAPNLASLGGGLIDATGNWLDLAPTFSGNTSIEYIHRLPIGGMLSGRVDFSYQTRQYFDPSNTEVLSQGAYGLLNLDVGYTLPITAAKLRIDAWVKNASNIRYITGAFDAGATFSGAPGAPRTFGMTFTARY